MRNKQGFTLIELSIVLVIIGLIIGGVLVGQDLIKAAQLRATVSQLEKINSAAMAFKLKYGQLPGDIQPTVAASYGLFQITGTCTTCRYNNGLIDFSTGGNSPYEYFAFWRHLSEANLIDGNFGRDATNPINATTGLVTDNSGDYLTYYRLFYPEIKAAKRNYWSTQFGYRISTEDGSMVYTGKNDFASVGFVSPAFAQALDAKIDDGMPNTGMMVDVAGSELMQYSSFPTENACTYGATDDINYAADAKYAVNADYIANNLTCPLYIKTAF